MNANAKGKSQIKCFVGKSVNNQFHLALLIFAWSFLLSSRAMPQTYVNLHSFAGNYGSTPQAGLLLNDKTLYGTTFAGGSSSNGTVFAVNTDGSDFTNLYRFSNLTTITNQVVIPPGTITFTEYSYTNSDGANPEAALVLSGQTLYGTTSAGGSGGVGTVFAINTDGIGFTNLHTFSGSDGASPSAGLILSGHNLFGTTSAGGSGSNGVVFTINTNGSGFKDLHNFSKGNFDPNPYNSVWTNGDGASPVSGLLISGSTLFGTASAGGASGAGTIFSLPTDGSSFANLYNFGAGGAIPLAGLILSSNTLYGMASVGGNGGNGTIFSLETNGSSFTVLYNFSGDISSNFVNNADGAKPRSSLVLMGKTLYGTAPFEGSLNGGTIFAINTDGTGFTLLHEFTSVDGFEPFAGLSLSGNTLYGTTTMGGSSNAGVVFSLSLPLPQLAISRTAANLILTWPANAPGFDYSSFNLQSALQLGNPTAWSPVSTIPITVNGWNTVTDSIPFSSRFYRLTQ